MKTTFIEIIAKDNKAPEWVLLFAAGWVEIEGEGKFMVDQTAFDLVNAAFRRRGNDIVFDYEHQTIHGAKAPAAGWIKELRWNPEIGIEARVDWTAEAAGYIAAREYRYFSPVFAVRKTDQRLIFVHSVALTNTPKTNHLAPILAKLTHMEEREMNFLKQVAAALGMPADTTEDQAIECITAKITAAPPAIPTEVCDALGLPQNVSLSSAVATIHATKAAPAGMVSREEFALIQAKLAQREADDLVTAAMTAGKITPASKDWAIGYAKADPGGFAEFVAKAPVVMPVGKLPEKTDTGGDAVTDETVLAVAKMMGNTAEDLKKYGIQ